MESLPSTIIAWIPPAEGAAFPWVPLGAGFAFSAAVMVVLWARQLATRNATAVDVAWAANLGFLGAGYALFTDTAPIERRWLVGGLAALWSARLAWHLAAERLGDRAEDGRYRTLRERWGAGAGPKFLVFFLAQAALDAFLSLPFALALGDSAAGVRPWEIAAALLVVVSVAGETLADSQLARFRLDPAHRGRTCRVGLWRFSRHPNYFFEWLAWCAFALLASGAPFGLLAWSAPLAMLGLILCVTGIPPTEAQALLSRGDDYRAYQRTTSAFFPWFPSKDPRACGTNR